MIELHTVITFGTEILKGLFGLAATVTIMGAIGLLGAMAADRFGIIQNR